MFDWFVRKKRSQRGAESAAAGEAQAGMPGARPAVPGAGLVSPDVRALVEAAELLPPSSADGLRVGGVSAPERVPLDSRDRPAPPFAGGRG